MSRRGSPAQTSSDLLLLYNSNTALITAEHWADVSKHNITIRYPTPITPTYPHRTHRGRRERLPYRIGYYPRTDTTNAVSGPTGPTQRHGPLESICGFRDHAVKAVGRRKRGRRPAAAPDFRKAVGAAAEAVKAVCSSARCTFKRDIIR